MSRLRLLYAYTAYPSAGHGDVAALSESYLARLRAGGFDVRGFCITPEQPAEAFSWRELDRRWRWGERRLLRLYERLEHELSDRDVLINSTGANLHPEFVAGLPVFRVFQCFDDPENSHNLSRPAAAAYDLSLVGNAAEVDAYRAWGVRCAEWMPLGVQPEAYDPALTETDILEGRRDIDLLFIGDRTSPWRRERLDRLARAMPGGSYFGRGWPAGHLPPAQLLAHLRRAKLGPNLHNSTGPVNYRTYYLPANGVMMLCDNKRHLSRVYEPGVEAVGFDSVEECVELARYYLAHDRERREIAAAGYRRARRDYTELPVFQRMVETIARHMPAAGRPEPAGTGVAAMRTAATRIRFRCWPAVAAAARCEHLARRAAARLGIGRGPMGPAG